MNTWPGPEAAEVADRVAIHDHTHTPASDAHEILAKRIWTAMYDLGAGLRPGSQWMTLGVDAEIFAGAPAGQRSYPTGAVEAFIGQIPVTTSWPPHDTRARSLDALTASDDVNCDVVIVNAPHSDVDLHTPERRADRLRTDTEGISTGLITTRPGGMLAAVVSTDWLDSPNPRLRAAVADHTDFLGAVRLPGATLRQAPGTDRPVDLILLRHRPHDRKPQHGPTIQPFQNTYQIPLDGHQVLLNEYFDAHPEHILGRLTSEHTTWSDEARTTVLAEGSHPLGARLEIALAHIVHVAHRDDLAIPFDATPTMQPRPDRPPDDGPEQLTEADRDVIRALHAKRHDLGPDPLLPDDPIHGGPGHDDGPEAVEDDSPSL
ncbi:hypothetical protein GCM10028784_30320 [Myceligenerans cantabricum]